MASPTRQQLLEARKRLERQIDILRSPAGGPDWHDAPPDNRQILAELEAELTALNAQLGREDRAVPNIATRQKRPDFHRLPLRLRALILCVFVLAPVMFFATRIFPPEDKNTILVISCFALAALYAFFGIRRRT